MNHPPYKYYPSLKLVFLQQLVPVEGVGIESFCSVKSRRNLIIIFFQFYVAKNDKTTSSLGAILKNKKKKKINDSNRPNN